MHIARFIRAFIACAGAVVFLIASQSSAARAGAAGGAVDFRAYALGGVSGAVQKHFTVHLVPGTTSAQAARIASYFRKFGLTVSVDDSDGILFVRGTYAQAAASARIQFARVAYLGRQFVTSLGREIYPPDIAAKIAATTLADGPSAVSSAIENPNGIEAGPANGYGPADIASYYDYGSIESLASGGSGTNIAIIVCGGISLPDVQNYETFFGLPKNVPAIVKVDGGSTGNSYATTGQVEVVIATAQAASITTYVLPTSCSYGNIADGVAQVLADSGTMKYIALVLGYGDFEDAYSKFGGESVLKSEDTDFASLSAKGVTTFAATGDSTAFSHLNAGDVGVFYPGSDPNVVSVGGTMAASGSSSPPTRSFEPASYSSGGGVSSQFAIPTWQMGVPGIASTTMRDVPDVALNADCQFQYYIDYADSRFLSCGSVYAAATWAGLLSLVDAGRVAAHKADLAKVPAKLYGERKVSGFFTDVSVGCNGIYCAAPGYDNVSGLGVPDASVVYSTLVGLP